MDSITLDLSDPTVWGKCPKCTRTGRGVHVGNYYAKAFPRRRAGRTAQEVLDGQLCENCNTQLIFMYEVN